MSTPSSSSSGKSKRSAPGPIARPPTRRRRRFIPCLVVSLIGLALLGLLVNYALTTLFTSSSSALLSNGDTRSASAVASDFMDALKGQQYSKAYLDLDGAVQALLTASDFDQQAKLADHCDGVVTEYTQIDSTSQKAVKRFTYSVTRKKLAKPYRFVLQLEQQGGSWTITSYGGGATLLPANTASCS